MVRQHRGHANTAHLHGRPSAKARLKHQIVAIENSVRNQISGKSNSIDVDYLKMRAESGFWDGTRNGDGEALGLTPMDILAAELRAEVAAERKTDLAAKEAMTQLMRISGADYRGRALLGF